jgi:hypothetical protein
MAELKAWCNDELGEVVAAYSAEEANEIILREGEYDLEDYGDVLNAAEWEILDNEQALRDEDGSFLSETVGEALRETGKPGRLWSFEP